MNTPFSSSFLRTAFFLTICLSLFQSCIAAESAVPSWIWIKKSAAANEAAFFRKTIPFDGAKKVSLTATCDNEMTIFFNGEEVASSKNWEIPKTVDLTKKLLKGNSVIAVSAFNQGAGAAGFITKIIVETDKGTTSVISDSSWMASPEIHPGWKDTGFDDSGWKSAVELAQAGNGPWAKTIGATTLDQLSVPKQLDVKSLQIKEGFKVELLHMVDGETQGSWVASCFDGKGRMIVSDQNGGLFRVTPPPIGGSPTDTIIESVPAPIGEAQGLCFVGSSLYVVTNSSKYPSGLYRVTDSDKDDMLDKVELLRSFPNTAGGEHGSHGVVAGPDGKSLYVVAGNQMPLTEMASSRVPKNWKEDNLIDAPLIGRGFMREVMAPGGWVAKTDLDGKSWELISTGMRNSYDLAFNRHGSLFTFDADMEWDIGTPWYRPTRVCEITSGGEFGWRALSKKWPVRWEDSLPPVVDIGPGSPTGIVFGYGSKFPGKYHDALYVADWTFGKLYAVHLQPDGSTYKAELELFLSGRPLPFADLSVNPKDGAMYFVTGGRKVQSGLYRITAVGSGKPDPSVEAAPPLLGIRRQLEAMHVPNRDAVDFSWKYLGHADRHIRFAARIALEHQPVAQWGARALAETDTRASLTALMALSRAGGSDHALLPQILKSLERIDFSTLQVLDAQTYLRDYQLAFSRFGSPDEAIRKHLCQKFGALFPAPDTGLSLDLAELLTYLGDDGFLPKAVAQLEAAQTQEEQIAYAKILRTAKAGWTSGLRDRFFTWVCVIAPKLKGGASFPSYMTDIKKDALAGLSEEEKARLQPILEQKVESRMPAYKPNTQGFVKDWTVKDLEPLLAVGLEGGRNFENGRNMFGATACAACHIFNNEGGAVGPDLTSAAGKFSPRDLLVQIIEPNKEISDQYGQLEVILQDGSTFLGRTVTIDDKSLVLNSSMTDASVVQTIDRKLIKSMEQSKTSMMPAGLLNTCKDADILDLLAYLLGKGDKKDPMFNR